MDILKATELQKFNNIERQGFDEEHDMFRQSLEDFVRKEVIPHHDKWERQKMVDRSFWEKMGQNGFLAPQIPEAYGGLGLDDYRYNAIIAEVLNRSGCSGPGIGVPVHSDIVVPYLIHYGQEEVKKKWLPKMADGTAIGAIAMSEPGAGSDLKNIKTTAVDMGDHFLVNGSKTFITNGYQCDIAVTAVRTDPQAGAKGISLLVIETGMEGYSKGEPFEKIGMHAQDTCELFFDNVKVPKTHVLGDLGQGFAYMMTELPQERIIVGACGLAAAEGALEVTIGYLREREAFGKPLSHMQTIRHKIAELATEVQIGRVFVDRCIELHTQKKLTNISASMVKASMTDLQCRVIDECVQLHGGYGYIWEYNVARAYADARAQKIYAGSNEIMKELISRPLWRG
ncbi:MAG: acyl-CoA dehydrogenase family protein [Flavobacteriales bacterium]|nr:acyl-CoA dehydrogenase family protein [Flavobacteriales bacterium]